MADWKKLKEKFRSGHMLEIGIVVLLVVVVLAVFFTSFGTDEEKADGSSAYESRVEAQLENILSQVEGAGKVDVFVSFRSEGETVIATETTTAADGSVTTAPVLVGGDVVVLEQKNPEITGVLIVASGANDLAVRFRLLEAAASALNIDQSIIKVYTKAD